eukprot:TCONS_00007067-protein
MVSYKTTLRLFGLLTFIILASLANAEKDKNIYLPEEMLLKFNGKPYVRVYQAMKSEQEEIRRAINKNEYPIMTDADEKRKKANKERIQLYKDIYQDEDGHIIIFPNSQVDAKLYFGIADYCNELKYMHTYTTPPKDNPEKKVAKNPLIKSFIVPYEIVYDILKRVIPEDNQNGDFSNTCDLQYANQFGFRRSDVDLLRAYALPNTLVTFMENTSPLKGQHLGLTKRINIIPDKTAIKDRFLPEHCKLTALGRILEEKKKTVPERKTVNNVLEDVLKKPDELDMDLIPKVVKDNDMETGIEPEWLEASENYRIKWSLAKRSLDILESFGKTLIDKKYRNEKKLTPIKRFNGAKNIFVQFYGKKRGEQMESQIEGGFLNDLAYFTDSKERQEITLIKMAGELVRSAIEMDKNKKYTEETIKDTMNIATKIMEKSIQDKDDHEMLNSDFYCSRRLN